MMEKYKAAKREGWVSVIVNLLLFGLKIWAGIISNSLALIADAWHTLSDSLTSVIVLLGVRLACKPADREHPYGHGRAEVIASLIIGVLLAVVSFEFLRSALQRFRLEEAANFGKTAIIVTVISIILKEGLAQYAQYYAKRFELLSLEADSRHHRSDALSSVIVLAGILLSGRYWWIDSLLSGLVAVIIGLAAVSIIRKAIDILLGNRSTEGNVQLVQALCSELTGKLGFDLQPHHIHEHAYGEHLELTFHVKVPGDWAIRRGHDLMQQLEDTLRNEHNIEATIHIEPQRENPDG